MAEVYNTDRFAELYAASQGPPMERLDLAAKHLADIFRANNIPCFKNLDYSQYLKCSMPAMGRRPVGRGSTYLV
ncbi:hypothetical protein IFR05_015326 [Cadophora sp. M221]|nr:hypothetical protein IFR05_015326 [Cadophora sp. M221]